MLITGNFRLSPGTVAILMAAMSGLFVGSASASAAAVTVDPGIQCSIGQRDDQVCDEIRLHPWAGKAEITLGMDGNVEFREADTNKFSANTKAGDAGVRVFKNDGSLSLRASVSARLEILEKFGVGIAAGFEAATMDGIPDGQDKRDSSACCNYSMRHAGPYLENAFYFPVQRINTWGLVGGWRRYMARDATATYDDSNGPVEIKYESVRPPEDWFAGFFVGPFYMNYVHRTEIWKPVSGDPNLDNSGSGLQLGVSGPISTIFPR